jgi:hypothetical protein
VTGGGGGSVSGGAGGVVVVVLGVVAVVVVVVGAVAGSGSPSESTSAGAAATGVGPPVEFQTAAPNMRQVEAHASPTKPNRCEKDTGLLEDWCDSATRCCSCVTNVAEP